MGNISQEKPVHLTGNQIKVGSVPIRGDPFYAGPVVLPIDSEKSALNANLGSLPKDLPVFSISNPIKGTSVPNQGDPFSAGQVVHPVDPSTDPLIANLGDPFTVVLAVLHEAPIKSASA